MWFNYEWPTVECLELQVKTLERHALSLSSSCRDFRLFVAYDGCLEVQAFAPWKGVLRPLLTPHSKLYSGITAVCEASPGKTQHFPTYTHRIYLRAFRAAIGL